MHGTPFSVHF